jgi:hypothetical protein
MKHKLAIAILLVIAAVHLVASLSVVPEENRMFQKRYDTGYQPTISEAKNLRFAYVLSFPLGFWVWLFHPARISPFIWYPSAVANALLWGGFIVWLSRFLSRLLGVANR